MAWRDNITKEAVGSFLKVLERLAFLIAAVLAIIPLWQIYSEADERRLDRAANFILAHDVCTKAFQPTDTVQFTMDGEEMTREILRIAEMFRTSNADADESLPSSWMPDAMQEALLKSRETIRTECAFIDNINRPNR